MTDGPDAPINRALAPWGLEGGVIEGRPRDHQGLSGVPVWRVRAGNEYYALRRLGGSPSAARRAADAHRLMRYAARVLPYVPWPRAASNGETVATFEGQYWTLETWSPGEASESPTEGEIRAAATALWQFHEVTHDSQCFGPFEENGVCRAAGRRLAVLQGRGVEGPAPPQEDEPELRRLAGRLRAMLPAAVQQALPLVRRVDTTAVRRQPIVGDVRRADVLFSGERVTGLVDYGAAMVDSPMVDLARMLGELAGDDAQLWAAGFAAYQRGRRLSDDERSLLIGLDVGGVVGASINWLRWLEQGIGAPQAAVATRLHELAERLEPIAAGNLTAERAIGADSA